MNYDDFSEKSPGSLVPTVYGAKAFVPDALPPSFDIAKIALQLAEASARLGELKGACRRLTNPYIFIQPLQRLEAQTSSAMEGTHTTADKLALAVAGVEDRQDFETREVVNYIFALEGAVEQLKELPITHRMLRDAHRTLLGGVGRMRGEDKLPGEFKRNQNMIGGRTLETARFIPAPPDQTPNCISQLESFINAERDPKLALIDMALAHYQFETIHPFADGNGRVGRMLISLMAISKGLLDVPALFISPALEGVKDDYIDHLYRVSAFGAWEEWINFFLDAVSRTSRTTVETIDRIIALHEAYRLRASSASQSNNILSVIDLLFEAPAIRAKDIVERIGVTDAAARGLLAKLVEMEILVEMDTYPKVWIGMELIHVTSPSEGR